MLLKKPYAFLIKRFKIIHVIMTVLLAYLVYKTNLIVNFLNEYMSYQEIVIGKNIAKTLFGNYIYLAILIIFVMFLFIFILMRFKKKPYFFYFINLFVCILLFIIYYYSHNIIATMEIKIINLQTIRLTRDILTVVILVISLNLLFTFVRAIGFNIKKLNFEKDLKDLNITSADNEEFELELSIDAFKYKRNFKKRMRYFKYTFGEHKYFIILGSLIFVFLLVLFVSFILGTFDKKYEEKQLFTTSKYVMGIDNSYLLTKNYRGDVIKKNTSFIVLEFKIKTMAKNSSFITARSRLLIDDKVYYHKVEYNEQLIDIGNVYLDDILGPKFSKYLLVYEVPTSKLNSDITFIYKDNNEKEYLVSIKPINLDKINKTTDYKLGEQMKINNFTKANINITNYEIQDSYKLDYRFCLSVNECYNSVEYLKPTLTGINDKSLLKIKGSIKLNNQNEEIENLYNYISYFGVIEYEKNNKKYYQDSSLNRVLPQSAEVPGTYFIEIKKEIKDADKIWLDFVIRGTHNRYLLKGA
ncbi:MAG: hypothetical protein RR847_02245 [Bacilli bacterium]